MQGITEIVSKQLFQVYVSQALVNKNLDQITRQTLNDITEGSSSNH